jgi:hypothetical protein
VHIIRRSSRISSPSYASASCPRRVGHFVPGAGLAGVEDDDVATPDPVMAPLRISERDVSSESIREDMVVTDAGKRDKGESGQSLDSLALLDTPGACA